MQAVSIALGGSLGKLIDADSKLSSLFSSTCFSWPFRPLQFNYLSYELFRKKNPVRLKKKKKKVDFGVLRTKVVEKFSVRLQKKKIKKVQALEIFIVRTKYSE